MKNISAGNNIQSPVGLEFIEKWDKSKKTNILCSIYGSGDPADNFEKEPVRVGSRFSPQRLLMMSYLYVSFKEAEAQFKGNHLVRRDIWIFFEGGVKNLQTQYLFKLVDKTKHRFNAIAIPMEDMVEQSLIEKISDSEFVFSVHYPRTNVRYQFNFTFK